MRSKEELFEEKFLLDLLKTSLKKSPPSVPYMGQGVDFSPKRFGVGSGGAFPQKDPPESANKKQPAERLF